MTFKKFSLSLIGIVLLYSNSIFSERVIYAQSEAPNMGASGCNDISCLIPDVEDSVYMNNPKTLKEISQACLQSPEGAEETGGVVYIEGDKLSGNYRLGFGMLPNIANANENSEAREVVGKKRLANLRE